MKTLTPTTNSKSSSCLEAHASPFRSRTPHSFEEISPLRSPSSQLKIKPHAEMGLLLDLVKPDKRCLSVHRLQIKSPMNRLTLSGVSSFKCLVSPKSTQLSQPQHAVSVCSINLVASSQIQNTGYYKRWFSIKPAGDKRGNLLDRFNGPKRKVRINVGECRRLPHAH